MAASMRKWGHRTGSTVKPSHSVSVNSSSTYIGCPGQVPSMWKHTHTICFCQYTEKWQWACPLFSARFPQPHTQPCTYPSQRRRWKLALWCPRPHRCSGPLMQDQPFEKPTWVFHWSGLLLMALFVPPASSVSCYHSSTAAQILGWAPPQVGALLGWWWAWCCLWCKKKDIWLHIKSF